MLSNIASRVNELLSPRHFLRNAVLCSQVSPWNTVPITALLSDSALIRMRATIDDIVSILPDQCVAVPGASPHVRLPFLVYPSVVVFKGAAEFADPGQLTQFVRLLNGSSPISIYSAPNCSYAVACATRELAVALWRAAQKVPFQGSFVETEFGSYVPVASAPAQVQAAPEIRVERKRPVAVSVA